MNKPILGPVTFQEMRVPKPVAPAPEPAKLAEEPAGVPFAGKTLVARGLVESVLWRPYAHHQAENLWTATIDMAGPQWNASSAVPPHIARSLQAITEIP